MARFFIDRPIFAWVISIFIMGIGVLSILTLPVAQYPQIAPPTVSVNAAYPGASARDGGQHRHAGDRAADDRP